ncbi:MAG: P-loop NTPase family protein [Bacteroidia bacterium]
MITTQNYYTEINHIGASTLPPALLKSHELVNKITQDGASWETYKANATIKRVIDLYLDKLNTFEAHQVTKPTETKSKTNEPVAKKQAATKSVKSAKEKKVKEVKKKKEDTAIGVEAIEDELKFIKRFVLMDGKTKSPEQVLHFLDALQKAIIERRIRKTSRYASEIKLIQEKLVELYNRMTEATTIHLKPETMQQMTTLVKTEKVMPSINFMKRYVRLQGKTGVEAKVKKLLDDLRKAVKNGTLTKADKYADKVNAMYKHITEVLDDTKKHVALDISKHELNGLMGILNDCGCKSLSGAEDGEDDASHKQLPNKNRVMSSVDFANMKFNTIGFTGKWLDFIGDPCKPFTAMVFGRPKMGKSYLCMELAGYLARNHGKVLYIAKEEKLDATLQKKLKDLQVQHPNLYVSDDMISDLSGYDFVVIDSVNKMELEPDDLDRLKANNPGVSFLYVFQTTKSGVFRGSQHFQHDVDIVIEIPEKGLAMQNGRFNQGGEMRMFES